MINQEDSISLTERSWPPRWTMRVSSWRISRATRTHGVASFRPRVALDDPVDVAGGADSDHGVFEKCAKGDRVSVLMIAGMFGGYCSRFSASLREVELHTSRAIAAMAICRTRRATGATSTSAYSTRRGVSARCRVNAASSCLACSLPRISV
jgi:hypothetical protein